jgi:signal transduction histidine kinase
VSTYEAGLETIRRASHDVYLLDYRLGARDGLELLRDAIACGCRAPVILLTGQGDEEVDREAMRAGAADYLVKGQVDARLLERSIRYALARSKVERMRDCLIAFASHELRTPVTAIRGYAETALLQSEEEVGELGVECLGQIIQAADHLTRLIDGFLDLSRVDAGRPIELTPEKFEVRGMVEEAVEIVRMAARRCGFQVHYAEEGLVVRGDRYKLLLVVVNLLSNADKYWPDGGTVEVRVAREQGHLQLSVADGGIGIPEEELAGLFAPFYRARDLGARAIRGTGLGLCLSKHLIEAHGGRIWVESQPGRGTTVTFAVPMQ